MRLILALALALIYTSPAGAGFRWAVCYSGNCAAEELYEFDLVVLDTDTRPPLGLLGRRGRDVLGYLSLGEVESNRAYFKRVKADGMLLGQNPNWPSSYYVDFRDPRWRQRVIGQLVPAILDTGFSGVFLDTLDDAAELERNHPEAYRGMSEAAADLVRGVRRAFPNIRIMVNRGYGLLPGIAPFIDILAGESVYTTYDADHKRYIRVPEAEYEQQVRWLKQARSINPKLRICSLDYWDPEGRNEIRRIYQVERANGFAPYVATRELDRIVRGP